jgi:TetR/AcrR family tetracycline transcriptional repressor
LLPEVIEQRSVVKRLPLLQSAGTMKLGQQEIVAAALQLVDEQGIDRLNMRALAGRLGVQASALYWHVGDKAELTSLMAGSFYARALATAPTDVGWRAWLLGFGHAFRASLLAHRDSAQLCAIARPLVGVQEAADRLAAPLVAAGLSRHAALSAQASVISLALGWAVYEQSNALHDHLAEMVGFDESFTAGLEAMVAGFPEPADTEG